MGWTDERVDQLKTLWTEGLSASQIARVLGGVTRNAVIGKVHRLGLAGRATPSRSERPRMPSTPKVSMRVHQPEPQRRRIDVDQQSGKFSGGEIQAPYFIAILASYLRAYRRHSRYQDLPTLALVPIDEAFSKLSGERISDCITALSQLDLQGVLSMSTGNIPYAFELCDHLLVVSKDERRVGRKLRVRNVAVSISRESDEGRRFAQSFA